MKLKKPLGYYDYTVVLTYLGMLLAFIAILLSINEDYLSAVIFLMGAGVCDMFDGTVAATKKRNETERLFGIQIDSLSDLISFGVMPAVFVYLISGRTVLSAVAGGLYLLAALIRLAFFNVSEEERQRISMEKRKVYYGVPVTTIAILLPLAYLIQNKAGIRGTIGYVILLILCGGGFVSPIEIKKPDIAGKICLVIVGILELMGVIFMGWDLI